MTDLETVEIEIEEANKLRAIRDNCAMLINSQPYKDVIEEGYFKVEAARLCMAKSSNLDEAQMRNIDGMMLGIGGLANFIDMVMRRGAAMDKQIEECEETRAEILALEVV